MAMTYQSFGSTKLPFWEQLQAGQEFNMKNMEFASAHAGNVFKFVVKLTSVKSPGEFSDVVTAHTREHFKLPSEELEALLAILKKTSSGIGKATKAGLGD
jgi:hypothetical protein